MEFEVGGEGHNAEGADYLFGTAGLEGEEADFFAVRVERSGVQGAVHFSAHCKV